MKFWEYDKKGLFYFGLGWDWNNWTIGFQRWLSQKDPAYKNGLAFLLLPLCILIGLKKAAK